MEITPMTVVIDRKTEARLAGLLFHPLPDGDERRLQACRDVNDAIVAAYRLGRSERRRMNDAQVNQAEQDE